MTAALDPYAPVTVAEFLAIFPEFAGVPVPAIQFQLDLSMKKQNKREWGQYWREAVLLETAHALALRFNIAAAAAAAGINNPTAIGFATSMSASPGSLSQSAQMPAWMTGDDELDSYYGRTFFGQQYLVLLIQVIGAGKVVVSPQVGMRGPNPLEGYRSITS